MTPMTEEQFNDCLSRVSEQRREKILKYKFQAGREQSDGRCGRYERYGRRHRTQTSRGHVHLSTKSTESTKSTFPARSIGSAPCAMSAARGARQNTWDEAQGESTEIGLVGPVGLVRRGTGHRRHAAMCRCPTRPTRPICPTAPPAVSAPRHAPRPPKNPEKTARNDLKNHSAAVLFTSVLKYTKCRGIRGGTAAES